MKTVHFKLLKKILMGLSALIISLFIIGYLAFYFFVQTNLGYYKNKLVKEISKATNKKVTIIVTFLLVDFEISLTSLFL